MAHSTALVTEPNEAMKPSPIVFTSVPPFAFSTSRVMRSCSRRTSRPRLVAEAGHHLGVADEVGEEDGAQAVTSTAGARRSEGDAVMKSRMALSQLRSETERIPGTPRRRHRLRADASRRAARRSFVCEQ